MVGRMGREQVLQQPIGTKSQRQLRDKLSRSCGIKKEIDNDKQNHYLSLFCSCEKILIFKNIFDIIGTILVCNCRK